MLTNEDQLSIHFKKRNVINLISNRLFSYSSLNTKKIVVLCIGTDRSTGDALGPLVGTFLKENYRLQHLKVYGTLHYPVHAKNLVETTEELYQKYDDAHFIAIDASLGRLSSIGEIQCGKGSLKPGKALQKNLPPIGDFYITGIVNVSGFMEYSVLQSTRLSLVLSMARSIAKALWLYDYKLSRSKGISF